MNANAMIPCPHCHMLLQAPTQASKNARLRCPLCKEEIVAGELMFGTHNRWQVIEDEGGTDIFSDFQGTDASHPEESSAFEREDFNVNAMAASGTLPAQPSDKSNRIDEIGELELAPEDQIPDASHRPPQVPASAQQSSIAANSTSSTTANADKKIDWQKYKPISHEEFQRSRRKRSPLWMVFQIGMGGLVAIPIALLIIWHVLGRDIANAGPRIAKFAPWAVPERFHPPKEFLERQDGDWNVAPNNGPQRNGRFNGEQKNGGNQRALPDIDDVFAAAADEQQRGPAGQPLGEIDSNGEMNPFLAEPANGMNRAGQNQPPPSLAGTSVPGIERAGNPPLDNGQPANAAGLGNQKLQAMDAGVPGARQPQQTASKDTLKSLEKTKLALLETFEQSDLAARRSMAQSLYQDLKSLGAVIPHTNDAEANATLAGIADHELLVRIIDQGARAEAASATVHSGQGFAVIAQANVRPNDAADAPPSITLATNYRLFGEPLEIVVDDTLATTLVASGPVLVVGRMQQFIQNRSTSSSSNGTAASLEVDLFEGDSVLQRLKLSAKHIVPVTAKISN